MKRIMSLLCCLSLLFAMLAVVVPAQTASAAAAPAGGLLRGKLPDEGRTKPIVLTDGNDSNYTTVLYSTDYWKWNLAQPTTITGYFFKGDQYSFISFLDANGNVLKTIKGHLAPYATDYEPITISNVSAIKVGGTSAGADVYEVDVSSTYVDVAPAIPSDTVVYPYDQKVYFGWDIVSNPSLDLAGYNVYIDGVKRNTTPITGHDYIDSNLTNGVPHTYEVTSVDLAGNESNRAAALTATASVLPDSPVFEYSSPPSAQPQPTVDKDLNTYMLLVGYNIYNIGTNRKEAYVYFSSKIDGPVVGSVTMRVYFYTAEGAAIGSIDYQTTGTAIKKVVIPVPAGAAKIRVGNSGGYDIRLHEVSLKIEKPAAPTNLSAIGLSRKANLSWTASAGPDVVGYNIYQDGVKINTSLVTEVNTTALNLTNGVTYSFVVKAVNSLGVESDPSNVATATPHDTIAPNIPTNVVTTSRDSKVDVMWDANVEEDLAGYNLYQDGVKINSTLLTNTQFTVEGLMNGTQYMFTVTAVDTSGNESEQSVPAPATPRDLTAPAVPSGLTATAGNTQVTLTWTANTESDFVGYYVYQDGVKLNSTMITETSWLVTGLTNGFTYGYIIVAVDASGNQSTHSAEVLVTPSSQL